MFEGVTVPWVGLLGAEGDRGPTSASQVIFPVTLEWRLENTGRRLHLLLKLRECKPGMVGRLCGWPGTKGALRGEEGCTYPGAGSEARGLQ